MVRRELHRKIPQQYKVIQKIREQMQEEGLGEEDLPREWWHNTWESQYPWLKQIRQILDLWTKRDKTKANYETLMKTTGIQGGNKKGDHSCKSLTKVRGRKHLSDKFRKTGLYPLIPNLKAWIKRQRSASNYVDREDLFLQYKYISKKALEEAEADLVKGIFKGAHIKLCSAIELRGQGLERRFEANKMKLLYLLMRYLSARLLKPQRLSHLSTQEEKARAQLSWRMNDYTLYLVCFAPLEELRLFVVNPEKVREHAQDCVVLHSDQIPFSAKVQAGRQLYAEFERQGKHWKEERKKNKEGIDQKIHGCEARCLDVLPGDVEEGKSEISSDGMAHLRGEATENQEKYKIAFDAEQCFYNVCNSPEAVKAGWGTVTITLTRAHMDLSNVSSHRRWIRYQAFNYNGKEIHYKAGEPIHHMHGKALL